MNELLKSYPELSGVLAVVGAAVVSALWGHSRRRDVFDPRVFYPLIYGYVTVSPCLYSMLFNEPYHVGVKHSMLLPTLYGSASAIVGFLIGASFAIGRERNLSLRHQLRSGFFDQTREQRMAIQLTRAFAIVGCWIALAFYAQATMQVLAAQPLGGAASKSGVFQLVSEATLRMLRLSSASSSLLLIVYVISDSFSKRSPWSLATLTVLPVYALLCIVGGERDFLLVGIVWMTSNWKKLSSRSVFFISMSVLLLLGAVPVIRRQGLGLQNIMGLTRQLEVREIGGSLMLLSPNLLIMTNVTELVPAKEPHWHGQSLLRAGLSFLPMMPDSVDQTPARWFAEVYDRQGQAGMAFSQDAEAYLNFGWIGLPVWFAGWGYLLGYLYRRAARPRPHFVHVFIWWQAAMVAVFAIRADSRTPMKLLVYGAAFVYVIHLVSSAWARREIRHHSGFGRQSLMAGPVHRPGLGRHFD